jgi:hypothetical protein
VVQAAGIQVDHLLALVGSLPTIITDENAAAS